MTSFSTCPLVSPSEATGMVRVWLLVLRLNTTTPTSLPCFMPYDQKSPLAASM